MWSQHTLTHTHTRARTRAHTHYWPFYALTSLKVYSDSHSGWSFDELCQQHSDQRKRVWGQQCSWYEGNWQNAGVSPHVWRGTTL